ncbi:MAG: type II secretion system protein [Candidatus Nealsonbacteria bacterium]|nr:type II secretion system protein [Candidatus Nealsonbacteria bacterium]
MGTRNRNAFTLIELLIVVTIIAVLTAVIIPQFSTSTEDASESSLQHNLRSLRALVGVYEADHAGRYPSVAKFAEQMTAPTNATGGTTGETRYGPYLHDEIPENPFNHSNTIAAVATAGQRPVGTVPGGAGWQYDESNGTVWPNNREYYP